MRILIGWADHWESETISLIRGCFSQRLIDLCGQTWRWNENGLTQFMFSKFVGELTKRLVLALKKFHFSFLSFSSASNRSFTRDKLDLLLNENLWCLVQSKNLSKTFLGRRKTQNGKWPDQRFLRHRIICTLLNFRPYLLSPPQLLAQPTIPNPHASFVH
jgi:hypothetical protein